MCLASRPSTRNLPVFSGVAAGRAGQEGGGTGGGHIGAGGGQHAGRADGGGLGAQRADITGGAALGLGRAERAHPAGTRCRSARPLLALAPAQACKGRGVVGHRLTTARNVLKMVGAGGGGLGQQHSSG